MRKCRSVGVVLIGLDCYIGIASSIPLQIYLRKGNGDDDHQLLLRDCLANYSFPECFAVAMWIGFFGFFFHLLRLALWFKIKDLYYANSGGGGGGGGEEEPRKDDRFREKLRRFAFLCLELGIGFAFSVPLQIYFGLFYPPNHGCQQRCSTDHSVLEYFAILLWISLSCLFFKELCLACSLKIKIWYNNTSSLTEDEEGAAAQRANIS